MANRTFLDIVAGQQAQVRTVEVSAGAADAGKIPNVNAAGVLDATLVNSTIASAGAGSSGKVVALDASGKLDVTVIPASVAPNSLVIVTTELIAAGALVNVTNVSGKKARNADAATGRVAHGFTISGAASGGNCTVFFGGQITGLTGKTPGAFQYLGAAGALTETPPVAAGSILQTVGVADDTVSVAFDAQPPITLA